MVASTLPTSHQRVESLAFDAQGRPLILSLLCGRCGKRKPLESFGLRTMGTGERRNQSTCSRCRGAHPKPALAEAVEP